MKVLKNITERQTIVIVPSYVDMGSDGRRDLMVTDDESGFDVIIGDKKISLTCDGFGNILTIPEVMENYDELQESYDDFIVLPGFLGEINVKVTNEDGNEVNDFVINEYISHQYDDYPDVALVVDKTQYEKVSADSMEPYFKAFKREERLGEILDK